MSIFNRTSGRGSSGGANDNPGNKAVCKFFLEGRCRFGDTCKNYHPPRNQQNSASSSTQDRNLPYLLSRDAIKADFTFGEDRPEWPLSAYGPGRDAPRQLLEGALEQSPEELRVQCYLAKASGTTQQYEQSEQNAVSEANQRAQQILSDLEGALKYVIDGKDVHPNREDLCQKATSNFNWLEKPSLSQTSGTMTAQSSSAFGSGPAPTFGGTLAFGQSSTNTSAFGGQSGGTSAFGKPSAMGSSSSPFGQPSALGGGPSAFGKPSTMGNSQSPFGPQTASSSSPFAQPAPTTGTPAFGQPSQPGGTSVFGQPSSTSGGSTFGKPSPFAAAPSSATPAFGSSTFGAKPATSSTAFGQTSQPAQQQSAFGQPSQAGQQQSAFGQPSQPGQQTPAFGQTSQPAQQQSAFGQPSQPGQRSTFGKASPFGTASSGSTATFGQSTFGASSTPNVSAFGKPSTIGDQQPAFGATANGGQSTSGGRQTSQPTSAFGATASRQSGQPLTSFKGQQIYHEDKLAFYNNPQTRKKERLWFPEGPPGPNPDTEAAPQVYEALGAVIERLFDFVKDNGTFGDGVVPEVPPRREWVSWDL